MRLLTNPCGVHNRMRQGDHTMAAQTQACITHTTGSVCDPQTESIRGRSFSNQNTQHHVHAKRDHTTWTIVCTPVTIRRLR